MRITESQLRRIIRRALLEAPKPDEPGIDSDYAMGQYLMPTFDRIGGEYELVDERDTDLEELFQTALADHYSGDGGTGSNLASIWHALIYVKQRGLYSDVLTPEPGLIYRVMSMKPAQAAKILGVPLEQVTTSFNKVQLAPSPPPFRGRGFISSWTMDPLSLDADHFIFNMPDHVSILLVAQVEPMGDNFLMNPRGFARKFELGRQYAFEQEVIVGGEIPVTAAAWLWHGSGKSDVDHAGQLERLVDVLDSELADIPQEGLNFYDMAAQEYAAWRQFIESVREYSQDNDIPESVVDSHRDSSMTVEEYQTERRMVMGSTGSINRWLTRRAQTFISVFAKQAATHSYLSPRNVIRELLKAVQ